MQTREKIYCAIIGGLIVAFGFYSWDFYRLNNAVNLQAQGLSEVVNYINGQIKASKPAETTQPTQ